MSELSPIFALSDRFVIESAALDPYSATSRGIPGFDHLVTDFSPEGCQARVDHVRGAIAQLRDLQPSNDDDRLAKDYLTERFDVMVAVHESGEWMRPLRALADLQDATSVDACGPQRYTVSWRVMNGADLDPAEMYEWAVERVPHAASREPADLQDHQARRRLRRGPRVARHGPWAARCRASTRTGSGCPPPGPVPVEVPARLVRIGFTARAGRCTPSGCATSWGGSRTPITVWGSCADSCEPCA